MELHQLIGEIRKRNPTYDTPFPMGVFGTLRLIPEDQGNAQLMLRRNPLYHKKAFLPHVACDGIQLVPESGASAAFEVFFYSDKDWQDIIPNIDGLEGFSPSNNRSPYVRTLAELRILPDDFADDQFNESIWYSDRNLHIPESDWNQFPSTPAWIYSNRRVNRSAAPILWPAENFLTFQNPD